MFNERGSINVLNIKSSIKYQYLSQATL